MNARGGPLDSHPLRRFPMRPPSLPRSTLRAAASAVVPLALHQCYLLCNMHLRHVTASLCLCPPAHCHIVCGCTAPSRCTKDSLASPHARADAVALLCALSGNNPSRAMLPGPAAHTHCRLLRRKQAAHQLQAAVQALPISFPMQPPNRKQHMLKESPRIWREVRH